MAMRAFPDFLTSSKVRKSQDPLARFAAYNSLTHQYAASLYIEAKGCCPNKKGSDFAFSTILSLINTLNANTTLSSRLHAWSNFPISLRSWNTSRPDIPQHALCHLGNY